MNGERTAAVTTVSGNSTTIPTRVRRLCNIHNGDRLHWTIEDDGTVMVEVVQQGKDTFSDFDGYGGAEDTESPPDHDEWGVK